MAPSRSESRPNGAFRAGNAAVPLRWPGVAIAAIVAAWITIDVVQRGPWTRLDAHASHTIRGWQLFLVPYPRDVVYPLTMFGQRVTILVTVGGFCLVLAFVRRTWQPIFRFAVALALLTVVIYAFKFGIGRTAPPLDTLYADGASYPSGHVPNAILMWGLVGWLAVEYEVVGWLRELTNVLRFFAPFCAFLGMALLDYHWLSDLVAGVAFGVILLRILHLVFDGRLGRICDGGWSSRPVPAPAESTPRDRVG